MQDEAKAYSSIILIKRKEKKRKKERERKKEGKTNKQTKKLFKVHIHTIQNHRGLSQGRELPIHKVYKRRATRHRADEDTHEQSHHKEDGFLRERASPGTTTITATAGRALGTDDCIGGADTVHVLLSVLLVVGLGAVMVLYPIVYQRLQNPQRDWSVFQHHGVKVPNVKVLTCKPDW